MLALPHWGHRGRIDFPMNLTPPAAMALRASARAVGAPHLRHATSLRFIFEPQLRQVKPPFFFLFFATRAPFLCSGCCGAAPPGSSR